MADPRTFVLIGNFEDNITPSLEKINTSIANLKKTFSGLSTRRGGGYDDITKSVGSLVSSQKHLANAVKEVREEVSKSIPYLAEYRKEVGKAAAANFAFARSTGQAARNESNLWRQAIREAEAYKRMANSAAAASRSVGGSQRRGGTMMPPPYDPPRGGGGGYDGRGRGSVARDATFAFGQTLGYQLSNTITGSIVQGFQIGVGLMVKPFQYFLDGFAERVKDESTDVQTAGAMFAIAQRKNMNMFENFNQAIRAQQQINYKLAESAAALPGATTEYVQMGKRVLDSMMTVLSKDEKGVSAFAQELDPNLKAGDKQGALATLTQRFTEKAVLLGQGSTYRGNYGVPQLLEQLIGSEKVSENMFNKFAMYRDLPIFQSVFKDMEGEIAKTGAYSAERIRKVFQLLDEALPNEVIQAHKNTMSGFLEALRSAFLDPEVGLFGLGRKIQGMEMAMVDQYGNFVDRQGKIVGSWDEAAKEQISLYESIQKILTGFGLPLSELATYLPQLFEPFAKLITPLESMFKVAQGFYRNFNIYTKEFENLAKGLSDMGDKKGAATMKKSAGARGTLLAISNLLTAFGDMSGAKFKDISTKLQDPAADIAAISKEVMTSVFNSKFVEELGFQIGLLVGGVLSTVAELLGFAKGAGDTRIVAGLKSGFEAAGGTQAFKDIFTNFFSLVFKVVKDIFMMAPAQITALVGASLMAPALMAGISVAIGNFLEDVIDKQLGSIADKLKGKTKVDDVVEKVTKARANYGGIPYSPYAPPEAPKAPPPKPTAGSRFRGFLKGAVGAGAGPQSLLGRSAINVAKNPLKAAKGLPVRIVGTAKNAFSAVRGGGLGAVGGGIKNLFGKGMSGLGKVGGIATVGVGIVEALMSLLSGDSLGTALGKGAGPVLGTIIGTALLGPLGGFIGGWIGSMESITEPLGKTFESVIQTLSVTFGFLTQVGKDLLGVLNWLGKLLPGVGKDFNALKAVISVLLSPFRMLELGVRGLYVLYLQMKKNLGLSSKEDRDALEREKAELDKRTAQFVIDSDQDIRGISKTKQLEAAKAELARLEAKRTAATRGPGGKRSGSYSAGPSQVEKDLKLRIKMLEEQVKDTSRPPGTTKGQPPAPTTPTSTKPASKPIYSTPGKPGFITLDGKTYWRGTDGTLTTIVGGISPGQGAPAGTPAGAAEAPKAVTQTAQNTTNLDQKATTQVAQGAAIQKSTDETKKNTATANNTLGNIRSGLMVISNKLTGIQNAMLGDLNNIQAGVASISSLLSSGSLKVKAEGMGPGNGPLGTAKGSLGRAQNMASQYGLSMTSWFRPGDKGYHGLGRAMDFSNGISTPQQMDFAQAMVNQYGTSLKELIYTPLGFGIKDGTRVPLSYWGPATNLDHYDHVHVAFAGGPNDGRMFKTQDAAGGWENSMVPGSVKVASITGNSAEGFGTTIQGGINVTVNAGNISDPDILADVVAQRILSEMQSDSIFV